jgi:hypothetical protein
LSHPAASSDQFYGIPKQKTRKIYRTWNPGPPGIHGYSWEIIEKTLPDPSFGDFMLNLQSTHAMKLSWWILP